MLKSLLSINEQARLKAVSGLDRPLAAAPEPDAALNSLVEAAALVCGTPISLVTLVGEDKQWFKAQVGLNGVHETSRKVSFCAHAILQDQVFEITDAQRDARFAANALVTGAPGIRFYAGAPLTMRDGQKVGALCVIDTQPRQLTDDQRRILLELSQVASHILETNRAASYHSMVATEWKTLNHLAPFGLYAANAEGQFTHVNPKWLEIYGLTEAQSLGHGWSRGLHPEDRVRVGRSWRDIVTTGAIFDQEFRVVRAEGEVRTVRSVARRVTGDDGTVVGLVGSAEDVTQARDQARLLDERRERLNLIVEATGVATAEWNMQTGEMRLSPEWAALTGHDLHELQKPTRQVVSEIVHPDDRDRVLQAVAPGNLTSSGSFEIEYRKQHKLGYWIWVFSRSKLVTRTADGKPEWFFSSQFDVTERKKADERLRQSERLLSKTGEVAGVGGWELDLETMALAWTAETRRIHGVSPDYVPDLATAIDFYAPTSRPVITSAVEIAIASGTAYDVELQLVRTDGSAIWVRAVGSVETMDGKPRRLYGAFQDISDRVARQHELVSEHQRRVLAAESSGIGVWELDLNTGKWIWDRQMFRLYGCFADFPLPDANDVWLQSLLPQDRALFSAEVAASVEGNRRFELEFLITWPDGSIRHLRSLAHVVADPKSESRILLGVNWDVTVLRKLAAELTEQHEWMRVTLRSIGDAVITADAQGMVTWLNPVAELMTGWSLKDATGRPTKQVFHILNEVTLAPAQNPLETALNERRVVTLGAGTILISRTGQQYAIEDSAAPIRDDNNHIQGVVMVFHDVTAERRHKSEVAYRATHDPLTGISNRSEFEIRLRQVQLQAQAGDGVHSLLYVDLDHFKLINDSCGHPAGDQVLQQVAKILADSVGPRDVLARVGGDEFAIILAYSPIERAVQIGQQICERMEVYRYVHEDRRFRLGASIGVVAIDDRPTTSDIIIQAADSACLLAKKTGRNRVHLWQELEPSLTHQRDVIGWAARLEHALDTNQFKLFVQEIRPLDSGVSGRHGEILLRIQEPDGTYILPGQFLPAAERFNLVGQIDRWVLRETVRTLQHNPAMADIRSISLNISGQSLADRAFHRYALATLALAGPDFCHRLVVEITETSAVENLAGASVFIEQLHAIGVRVALDDFGAGTASFGYLRALKVDCLKIDGQFVQGLVSDPLSQVTVRCFTEVAQVLGIPIVAEYVDHPEILKTLKTMGVTFAQGYLIAVPVPILDFLLAGSLVHPADQSRPGMDWG